MPDADGVELPARLLYQLPAMGEEENTQARRGCLRDDGAGNDRLA